MSNFYKNNSRAFTLIELLVVISIISLLSSVVLSSVGEARKKGKDTAIKESINQFETMLALNYNDYGNYCNLLPGYIDFEGNSTTSCTLLLAGKGKYGDQARDICENIGKNSQYGPVNGTQFMTKMYFRANENDCNPIIPSASAYSLMVYLNKNKWYCVGSSGRKGEYSTFWNVPGWAGCYNNP